MWRWRWKSVSVQKECDRSTRTTLFGETLNTSYLRTGMRICDFSFLFRINHDDEIRYSLNVWRQDVRSSDRFLRFQDYIPIYLSLGGLYNLILQCSANKLNRSSWVSSHVQGLENYNITEQSIFTHYEVTFIDSWCIRYADCKLYRHSRGISIYPTSNDFIMIYTYTTSSFRSATSPQYFLRMSYQRICTSAVLCLSRWA